MSFREVRTGPDVLRETYQDATADLRYPTYADDILAATIAPHVLGGWLCRIYLKYATWSNTLPTRTAAHDWLIKTVDRMDNPEKEDRDAIEAA